MLKYIEYIESLDYNDQGSKEVKIMMMEKNAEKSCTWLMK